MGRREPSLAIDKAVTADDMCLELETRDVAQMVRRPAAAGQ